MSLCVLDRRYQSHCFCFGLAAILVGVAHYVTIGFNPAFVEPSSPIPHPLWYTTNHRGMQYGKTCMDSNNYKQSPTADDIEQQEGIPKKING
jgi:hypothetical protein